MIALEFTDRYEGIGRPHPWRYCRGACEATGVVPVRLQDVNTDNGYAIETDERLLELAQAHHALGVGHEDGPCDGWHFVTCPDCNGTRLADWPTAIHALPSRVRRDLRFLWQHGILGYARPAHWARRKQLAVVLGIIFGRRS